VELRETCQGDQIYPPHPDGVKGGVMVVVFPSLIPLALKTSLPPKEGDEGFLIRK